MPITAIGQAEMEAIFGVTDALGIHREQIVVPLRPRTPGSVRRKPNGQYEITVDASREFDDWLKDLGAAIAAAA
jgi:hypothetical protein